MAEKAQEKDQIESYDELGDKIATGIAEGLARLQPKKVSFGEYARRHARKVKLARESFDNGYRLSDDSLTDREIELLNQITTSGRYLKRKVEVIVRNEGRPIAEQVVEIRYSNKTPDQRMENTSLFRSFEDLLKQIVMEQEVNEENLEVVRPSKSRAA